MKKQVVFSIAVAMILMFSMFAVLTPKLRALGAAGQPRVNKWSETTWKVNPAYARQLTSAELDATPSDPIPFNIDMVNSEPDYTLADGSGIYVAVLDTGLLSNYESYFPPAMVNIKTEWGIGFSHDVTYNPVTQELDFGPLRSDRGFYTHDAWNPNPDPNPFEMGFGSGHGTHVTSIITGYEFWRGTVSTWIKGVAPKATIIPVLVLDDWLYFNSTYQSPEYPNGDWFLETGGTDEMVAAGIRYVGDLARSQHIKIIINMSLGGSEPTTIIEDAVNYAIGKGVIIVASAGNEGYDGMGWPGAYPQVISVAAAGWTQEYGGGNYNPYDYYWWWKDVPEKLHTKNTVLNWTHPAWSGFDIYGNPTTDPYWNPAYAGPTGTFTNKEEVYLTDFSSRPNKALGQKKDDLDLAAPGAAIRGPYKDYFGYMPAFYAVWGTSQAAPHVSGIAAIVEEMHPQLNQAGMEKALVKAAHKNPMPSCGGAYVSDAFSYYYALFACYKVTWKDHDAGAGFLTLDEALKAAH
jgi:subtilisin family serine protease